MSTPAATRPASFTDEQRRAIETRGVSVSLSAGAGCGKTFVLTERYLSHFNPKDPGALGPEQLGHLVAITFTERAAREMRDRIRRRCYERLSACAIDEAHYWAALLRALDSARISTIHSFCAALLRSRAVEAGIDPQFGVLEQAQGETLLSEAVDDEMRRLLSERDETTLALGARFGLDGLRDMVRMLAVEGTPQDWDHWLAVSDDELVGCWSEFHTALLPRLAAEVADSDAARAALDVLAENRPSHAVMRKRCEVLAEALNALAAGPVNGDALAELFDLVESNAKVQGGGGPKAWNSAEAYETFRDAATSLRDLVRRLRGSANFDSRAATDAAATGRQMLELAARIRTAYAKRKQDLRVLDFDDLLIRAHSLLTDERHHAWVGRLGEHITLLLVDEFQDTDPLQVQLVEALCGEGLKHGKLFFVGDYKQSIYRFRGADPGVFRSLRGRTPAAGQQSLSLNFRSQPAILHFVNALFFDALGDGYEPLRPHRPQVSPLPAVEFLWAPAAVGQRESVEQLRQREADWIARRIRTLLDDGEPLVWDAEAAAAGSPAARPATCGDVAILFRALTHVEAYEAALRRWEIDYYLVGGHAFYAQQEIYDLLNLLRTLNSSVDVVSLIGALRSPFFSLADETIFWLAQHPGGVAGGLFADAYPPEISPAQQHQAALAARTIERLRACKDRLRICELIEMALEWTGYDAVLLGEFLGERKLANLLKLQEQARSFQRGDFLGLADFIAQLAEFVVSQPDEPLAATHSEDTNVVRLMSVHQSKGLEFPIVIVPDLNRRQHGMHPRAHFDARLGPLVRLPAEDDATPVVSGHDLWRYAEKAEEAAEMNRLLYVATTRAADRLILSGGVGNPGDADGPWTKLLARRFDLTNGRCATPLPAGQALPSVRVTTEEPVVGGSAAKRPARIDVGKLVERVEAKALHATTTTRAIEPIAADVSARRQYSFSRLSGELDRKYERLDQGAWASDATHEPHDPRSLGTLVHAVLAAMDFARPPDIRRLVERFAEQHLPDRPEEIDEAVAMIEQFAGSDRARQLAAAAAVHAEVEFLLAWPSEAQVSGEIVLRGFIDLLYRDAAGGWHVLDFKTNRVPPAGVAALADRYEMQMLVYGLATERILKSQPVSLTLHFLRTGQEHAFAWDEAARRRSAELVNNGIAAATSPLACPSE